MARESKWYRFCGLLHLDCDKLEKWANVRWFTIFSRNDINIKWNFPFAFTTWARRRTLGETIHILVYCSGCMVHVVLSLGVSNEMATDVETSTNAFWVHLNGSNAKGKKKNKEKNEPTQIMNKISGKRRSERWIEGGERETEWKSENRGIPCALGSCAFFLHVFSGVPSRAFLVIFICVLQSEKVCWFLQHNPWWSHANKECQFAEQCYSTCAIRCVKYKNCAAGKSKAVQYVSKNSFHSTSNCKFDGIFSNFFLVFASIYSISSLSNWESLNIIACEHAQVVDAKQMKKQTFEISCLNFFPVWH